MSTELVRVPIQDMQQMAGAVAGSKLFGMQNADQAFVLMALCQSEGKDPIQAVRQYHIINGRPSMRADAMQAEFQARGGEIEFHQRDAEVCDATFRWNKTVVRVEWTMKMATTAGLNQKPGPWKTAPRAMLHARCVSEGVRAVMPGVVAGIYTPEETEDIPIIEAQIVASPTALASAPPQATPPRQITPRPTAPRNASPTPPPDWNPQAEFVALATDRGFDIHNSEGKVSGAKVQGLLCKIYGTETAEMPAKKSLWESALKALQVYEPDAEAVVPAPEDVEVNTSDLDDPFAN